MDRINAILTTHPTVKRTDENCIAYDSSNNVVILDESKITTEMDRLEAEFIAQEYARKRKSEYNDLNQFEMQFDDKANSTTAWEDKITAIKTKWPKDNSGPVE